MPCLRSGFPNLNEFVPPGLRSRCRPCIQHGHPKETEEQIRNHFECIYTAPIKILKKQLLVYGVHEMICVPFWYLRPPTGNRSTGLITRNATPNGRQQQMRYTELVLDTFDYSNRQKLFWFLPDVCNEHGLCHGKASFCQKEVKTPKCEDLWFCNAMCPQHATYKWIYHTIKRVVLFHFFCSIFLLRDACGIGLG